MAMKYKMAVLITKKLPQAQQTVNPNNKKYHFQTGVIKVKNFLAPLECLIDPNASLAQSGGRNGFKEVVGRFTPCLEEKASPEIQCASVEEYEKALKNLVFDMYIGENKVVINDLKQPIQQRIELVQIKMGELALISLSPGQFV